VIPAAPPTTTLSERASKQLLARYGVPLLEESTASTPDAAADAATRIGFPVVVKLCGERIAHKTERGLVRLRLDDAAAVRDAAGELLAATRPDDGAVELLVAPMVLGNRELIAGVVRDPQFGPCVMLGIGGVFAEAIADVAFRVVPLGAVDADELIDDLRIRAVLGAFRGEPPVDRAALRSVLLGLSDLAVHEPDVVSVDVNPLVVVDGVPVAVDALVERAPASSESSLSTPARARPARDAFDALFDPRGVVVAGASSHPGKFGFVALHNVLAHGYPGAVSATNLEGAPVLGLDTVRSVEDLPDAPWDLVFVCTPAGANPDLLRACAKRGIRAAFLTSAGYGEAGDAGRQAERELVALSDELGILLAGPNGQGVVSTPSSLCAQIVAPYPPRGRIAVASQSGNFVSSFLNWSLQTGVGVSRAVSAGNAAAVTVADYLAYYADDAESAVSLAYVEGVGDGHTFFTTVRDVTRRKPVVLVKGGATTGGQRAAASHTGSLASDDRVFDGMARQAGATRAATIEEAFEAAATFATQPLPRGPRTIVLTTAGGWGVVTADAIARSELELAPLPGELLARIDEKLPPRWSRNNPVDLAGGETRDTIPEVLELVASHPDVDAVVYLGLGIQSNQARLMREGRFYPDHGLERIVAYHERQDERFARAAAAVSDATGKPILTASELAIASPDNPGPATVRETGRVCYASANRAVVALEHLWRYARHRQRREGG
jgi:acetyltransferase